MKRIIYPILILIFTTMACSIGSIGKPAPTATQPMVEEPSATPLFEVPTDVPVVEVLPEDTPLPPEPTEAPIEPSTPTNILPTATTQIKGPSYFNEDFTNNVDNWKQWVPAGDATKNYVKVVLGRLRFELPSTETYVYVQNTKFNYSDVLTVAKFETVETDGGNGVAVLCRVSDKGWYEVRVSTMGSQAGRVWLYRYDPRLKALGENPYVNLLLKPYSLESVPISAIKNGFATNTIGLQCNGDTLSVYANGKAMIHPRLNVPIAVTDSTLTDGTVGLGVMSFSTGKSYVEFINASTNAPQ
jgi:hypothetical protein